MTDNAPDPATAADNKDTPMEDYDKILQAIYEAMREVNELDPDSKLAESPDTMLIGEGGTLNSLGLVSLATVTEANIERSLSKSVSVIDIFMAEENPSFDVAALAHDIATRIGCAAPA